MYKCNCKRLYVLVVSQLCDLVHECTAWSPRVVGRCFSHFDLCIRKALGIVFTSNSNRVETGSSRAETGRTLTCYGQHLWLSWWNIIFSCNIYPACLYFSRKQRKTKRERDKEKKRPRLFNSNQANPSVDRQYFNLRRLSTATTQDSLCNLLCSLSDDLGRRCILFDGYWFWQL